MQTISSLKYLLARTFYPIEVCMRPQFSFPNSVIYACFISVVEMTLLASISASENAHLIRNTFVLSRPVQKI